MTNLPAAVQIDRSLKAELIRQFPELSDDEQTLIDTLDGISDLDEQIAAVMREAVARDAMANGLDELIEKQEKRCSRLRHGAQKIRDAVILAMQDSGRKSIKKPDMTLVVSVGRPGVQITDETLLPEEFVRVKTVREPDKEAIGAALKEKRDVPGAVLKNPRPYINCRLT